jgi:hypothetical protein
MISILSHIWVIYGPNLAISLVRVVIEIYPRATDLDVEKLSIKLTNVLYWNKDQGFN